MGVFLLSTDLGRSYHGSVSSLNGPIGRSYHGSVSSLNGPRSFLSWECFYSEWT